MRTSANPTFLLLPFLLTTPSLLIALTSLSLASSIGPFPHLFSRKTSKNKNFLLIPTSPYYLPKIPITAASIFTLNKAFDGSWAESFSH